MKPTALKSLAPLSGGTKPSGWMAYFRVSAVQGSMLHPGLANVVEDILQGHVPVISVGPDELSVMCSIVTNCPREAAVMADELTLVLRERLGVSDLNFYGPELSLYRDLDEYFAPDAAVHSINTMRR